MRFAKVKLGQDWGKLFDWRVIINGVDVMTDVKWDRYERDHPILRNTKIPLMEAAEAAREAAQVAAAAQQPGQMDQDLYEDANVQYS